MAFKAVHFKCYDEVADNLSFLLQEKGYLGTWFERGELIAYAHEEDFNVADIEAIAQGFGLSNWEVNDVKDENWNALWEANFTSSDIGDNIHIRAPFQEASSKTYDLVVHPNMAFGTGHHATTRMSALALDLLDCTNKWVLDMGCGSGILAVLASKKGAERVFAIDYDVNAVENARENAQLNACTNVEIIHADSTAPLTYKFDIIVSNIVKNINLRLLPEIVEKLNDGGTLVVSGFLTSDLEQLKQEAKAQKLTYIDHRTEDEWLQAQFLKQG